MNNVSHPDNKIQVKSLVYWGNRLYLQKRKALTNWKCRHLKLFAAESYDSAVNSHCCIVDKEWQNPLVFVINLTVILIILCNYNLAINLLEFGYMRDDTDEAVTFG